MEEVKEEICLQNEIKELNLEEDNNKQDKRVGDENVLQFLDSVDSYLNLFDSLSSTLRQGWMELASARHSMGASRINGTLLDLKVHSASTSLQVTQDHDSMEQPNFMLRKWGSFDSFEDQNSREDELWGKPGSPHLRHWGNSQLSEEITSPKLAALKVDDQVQRERSRSLSVFGTLVPPKLRAAQLSFETALETLVEIANTRSAMLSVYDCVCKQLQDTKEKR